MMYTISTSGQEVILTLTPDISINSPDLNRTNLLLDHAISSSFSSIIFDMGALSHLNAKGSWTIFQAVFTAQEHGKCVFLYNVQPSITPVLAEAGILTMADVISSNEELDIVY